MGRGGWRTRDDGNFFLFYLCEKFLTLLYQFVIVLMIVLMTTFHAPFAVVQSREALEIHQI